MSMERTVEISCPVCGKKGLYQVWDSINTGIERAKEKAISGELFEFKCDKCGNISRFSQKFLFHDMTHGYMIQHTSTEAEFNEAVNVFKRECEEINSEGTFSDLIKNYRFRVVRSLNEFREKVCIFDAGLDDRVIEICKVYELSKMAEERPEVENIESLFYIDESGSKMLQVMLDDNETGCMDLLDQLYDAIKEKYAAYLNGPKENDILVDLDYAMNIVHKAS